MAEAHELRAAQIKPFGRRKDVPQVTITRGTRQHSFYVRPWLSAFVGLSGLAAVGLTIGAGGYMLLHDDVVAVLSERMGDVERSYQSRVSKLRTELDRAQSGKAIAEATLMQDMAALLRRQDEIAARHDVVARVVEIARDTDLLPAAVASTTMAARPMPRPAAKPMPQVSLAVTAFAPVDKPQTAERIDGARRTIDLIAAEQDAVIETISSEADAFLGSLRSAIEDVPVPAGLRSELDGAGGPYVPLARTDDFADRAVRAELLLEAVQRVKSVTDKLPIIDPVKGRRSSGFGGRLDPINGKPAFHSGLDYAAPRGTSVRATAAGRVRSAGRNGGYGLMIEIDHGDGLTTRYAHLSRISVERGDTVVPGAIIGKVGSTGRSTGPHLHYETRKNGKAADPSVYLRAGRKLASLLRR